jgi:hypothetical protein
MFNRRNFLSIGTSIFGSVCLADILKANQQRTLNKSVVMVWLSGGASQIEFTHPIPDTPSEFRSVTGFQNTNITGIKLAGLWNELSKNTDKLAILGAMTHQNAGHSGGTSWMLSGYDNRQIDNNGIVTHPSIGSMVSRYKGPSNNDGIPNYVRTNQISNDGPSWLGSAYSPFDISGNGRNNIQLNTSEINLSNRRELLNVFDSLNREIDNTTLLRGMDSFSQQAYSILTGNKVKEAFDIDKETTQVKEKYGNSQFGRNLLLARRLCEAGTGFINISHGSWDWHTDLYQNCNRDIPNTDKCLSTFINDIYQRGLNDNIVLIVMTEFGRTSRLNQAQSRDHQSGIVPVILSGAVNGGQIIGEASSKAEYAKNGATKPIDLIKTIFNFMNIPHDLQYTNQTGRPTFLLEGGNVISGLLL